MPRSNTLIDLCIPGYCLCGNPIEGNTNHCASCNREARKNEELAIKKDDKKFYKIKAVSDSRSKRLREYSKNRDEYLAEHPICECCNVEKSNQIHHKAGRIGDLLTDKKYFLATCGGCHREIELNPQWAIMNGYSVLRTNK